MHAAFCPQSRFFPVFLSISLEWATPSDRCLGRSIESFVQGSSQLNPYALVRQRLASSLGATQKWNTARYRQKFKMLYGEVLLSELPSSVPTQIKELTH
jgi:hypothetical protein